MPLPAESLAAWQANGWLLLPGYAADLEALEGWVGDLAAWPETPGKWMKYFEPGPTGERQLCRMENFLEFHAAFDALVNGPDMLGLVGELLGEEALLFKEKINFKLPGGAGFAPHQDAPAFTSFEQSVHITAMLSVDATTAQNGCLEIARILALGSPFRWRRISPSRPAWSTTSPGWPYRRRRVTCCCSIRTCRIVRRRITPTLHAGPSISRMPRREKVIIGARTTRRSARCFRPIASASRVGTMVRRGLQRRESHPLTTRYQRDPGRCTAPRSVSFTCVSV